MGSSVERCIRGALFVCAALAVSHAGAQSEAWRCGSGSSVTYSQVPCPGGRPVGATARHETDKFKAPPQDRAVAARRASLTPEERHECHALEIRMREEQRMLRTKGEAATLQDEMPLVDAKKRFRELKC